MVNNKTPLAPFLHVKKNVINMTWIKILSLAPVIFSAIYFFRFAAVERLVVVLMGAFLAEIFSRFFSAKKTNFLSGESLWEGLLLALLLPTSLPLPICFTGGFLMVLFFREFYGGPYQNLVPPVLAALLFLIVSFPILIFDFVPPANAVSDIHPYIQWKLQAAYAETPWQLFVGFQSAPMGTASILACLMGACILTVKRMMAWDVFLIYMGIYALVNRIFGFPFELSCLGGEACFLAIFILPRGSHVPHGQQSKWIYCSIAAILAALIKRYSFYHDGSLFGIMMASCMTPWLNQIYRQKTEERVLCVSN